MRHSNGDRTVAIGRGGNGNRTDDRQEGIATFCEGKFMIHYVVRLLLVMIIHAFGCESLISHCHKVCGVKSESCTFTY